MTGRSQRCWPIRQVRRVSSATHSFEHFFGGVQLKWALFWANDWNLTLLSNPLFFEHFFELITHKSTFLSALLINETFLNTFLRTQKSGFALKSAFLSGFTLLRAFLSTQKSAQKSKTTQKSALESKSTLLSAQKSAQTSGFAQKSAQMSSFTQKRAQMSKPLKKVLKWKEWNAQNSVVPLKRGLK